jgi:hypothetical protein
MKLTKAQASCLAYLREHPGWFLAAKADLRTFGKLAALGLAEHEARQSVTRFSGGSMTSTSHWYRLPS